MYPMLGDTLFHLNVCSIISNEGPPRTLQIKALICGTAFHWIVETDYNQCFLRQT